MHRILDMLPVNCSGCAPDKIVACVWWDRAIMIWSHHLRPRQFLRYGHTKVAGHIICHPTGTLMKVKMVAINKLTLTSYICNLIPNWIISEMIAPLFCITRSSPGLRKSTETCTARPGRPGMKTLLHFLLNLTEIFMRVQATRKGLDNLYMKTCFLSWRNKTAEGSQNPRMY